MQDCNETDMLSVTTTVGSLDDARRLAEVRLTIKTLPPCVPALQALFASSHPYEVPQFLATVMVASPAYAQWARSELGGAHG
jgi:uncharacterized protein involved in tolerance to divalent cations